MLPVCGGALTGHQAGDVQGYRRGNNPT